MRYLYFSTLPSEKTSLHNASCLVAEQRALLFFNRLDTNALILGVYAAYKEADRSVSAFATKAGLQCPGGCGRCCESPFIEASPLECFPLAASLLPKAEEWLARLELHLRLNRTLPSSCPFYVSFGFGKGFCSVYEERPLICRLYGFAAYIDDAGNAELDSCHYHTEHGTHLPSVDPDGTGTATAPHYRSFNAGFGS